MKLKVAVGDDAGRVAAVRAAAGPATLLRLDANGGWSVDQALAAIGALEAAGLELVEEPVHGIEAVRAVRAASAARIAIDETAALPGALESGCADAVCLKLARCGGISGLLAAARTARADGCEIYVASTYDGPVGIAAALHACAALAADGPLRALRPCDARVVQRPACGAAGQRRRDRRPRFSGTRRRGPPARALTPRGLEARRCPPGSTARVAARRAGEASAWPG